MTSWIVTKKLRFDFLLLIVQVLFTRNSSKLRSSEVLSNFGEAFKSVRVPSGRGATSDQSFAFDQVTGQVRGRVETFVVRRVERTFSVKETNSDNILKHFIGFKVNCPKKHFFITIVSLTINNIQIISKLAQFMDDISQLKKCA